MKPIALLYARRDVGGGSTSFAVHLFRAMQMAGIDVTMYRLTNERKQQPAGLFKRLANYAGVFCHYITPSEARILVKNVPTILVSPEHSKRLPEPDLLTDLIRRGMRVVIHDPNEFMGARKEGVFDHLKDRDLIKRPICIRPTMRQFFKDAHFIPHPYVRVFSGWQGEDIMQRRAACSIARITFVKRTSLILSANRKLTKELKVQLHGAENRLYTHFTLQKDYPEFKQGGYNLPLEHGVSARMAKEYTFAVDFTYFPHDGGGSQYTFMEAWDAGTVNVVHEDWLRYNPFYNCEMQHGDNCLAIVTSEELADLLQSYKRRIMIRSAITRISKEGTRLLETVHDPVAVAKAYYKEMTR